MDFCAFSGLLNGMAATVRDRFLYVRTPRLPRRDTHGPSCLRLSVWDDFSFAQPDAVPSVNRAGGV